MAVYYEYLISSLPMLGFGMKPPFSFERFLDLCRDFIKPTDWQILKQAQQIDLDDCKIEHPAVKSWVDFEVSLRNDLVKIRAARKKIEPNKYLRKDGLTQIDTHLVAANAHRMPAILESERLLDRERWHKLDDLSVGHYFDLDILIIYALKLLILQKWDKINKADKEAMLEDTLVNII